MWNPGYEIVACLCIGALIFSPHVSGDGERRCKTNNLDFSREECKQNERCVGQKDQEGICNCLQGFYRFHENCVLVPTTAVSPTDPPTETPDAKASSSGSSVAAGLLIPAFLVALAALLFFGARRYKWVQRFRQYQQNRYGNVLVTRDEDDDDPPIA